MSRPHTHQGFGWISQVVLEIAALFRIARNLCEKGRDVRRRVNFKALHRLVDHRQPDARRPQRGHGGGELFGQQLHGSSYSTGGTMKNVASSRNSGVFSKGSSHNSKSRWRM